MKFSGRTIQILKNFAQINPSLLFTPENVLYTISPQKTIMAKASIYENIPQQFAIYDLSRFLGVLSLFEDPELDLDTKRVTLKSKDRKLHYVCADPSMIVTPTTKEIAMPQDIICCSISAEVLQMLQKALGILQLPEIAFIGDGTNITISAMDSKNPTNDTYDSVLENTSEVFNVVMKAENMKVLCENYNIEISTKGICHFIGNDIEYWIACESLK